jgi:hypothetical protein
MSRKILPHPSDVLCAVELFYNFEGVPGGGAEGLTPEQVKQVPASAYITSIPIITRSYPKGGGQYYLPTEDGMLVQLFNVRKLPAPEAGGRIPKGMFRDIVTLITCRSENNPTATRLGVWIEPFMKLKDLAWSLMPQTWRR